MEIQNTNRFRRSNLNLLSLNLFLVYIITIFLFSDSAIYSNISKLVFIGFAFLSFVFLFSKPIMIEKFHLLLVINLLWFWVSILWAVDTGLVIKRSFTFLNLVVMDILLYAVIIYRKDLTKIIKYIAYGGVLMCIYAIFVYGLNDLGVAMETGYRLGEAISQENIFGFYAAIAAVLCFFYGTRYKNKKWLLLSAIPLFFALLSGSKKAFLIILLGVILTLYFDNKNKKNFKKIAKGILFIIIGLLILQLPIFDMVLMRLESALLFMFGEGIVDKSTMYRHIMIEAGFELFKQNPIIGYGTSNYGYHFQNLTGYYFSYAHNNYIELLVNNGLVGFFLYYSLMLSNIKTIFIQAKKTDTLAQVIFILIILLLVSDITSVTYYNKFYHIVITLSYALMRILKNENTEQNRDILSC